MRVRDIAREDFEVYGDREREITGIACDSRAVQPGNLFVAVRGGRFDGADFIEAAVEKCAVSVLYGKDPARTEKYETLRSRFPGVAWIAVNDCRDALAYVSNILYRRPSEECLVIGITGTNGKTTTSYLIKDIVERGGGSAGLIGTISYLIKGKTYDAPHTTPEAPDFQKLLRAMVEEGCSHVISEVSSHALAQKRVEYTRFRVGVFTNLTRDHLDFHLTMEEYYRAKERLFTELVEGSGAAVINTDDPYGKRLADMLRERRAGMRVLTFGIEDGGADVVAYEIKATFKGTAFKVRIREHRYPCSPRFFPGNGGGALDPPGGVHQCVQRALGSLCRFVAAYTDTCDKGGSVYGRARQGKV
ncbi:MAG: hypothetical protein K8I29_17810 [Alphaproteobacteria bacterium]|uniref:UDP-N-acetylmuramoyl-L-alanyl-D-glutamate--2, 6-diaminopimelate ligase n=1 Tax=Candidatus Nitrobium versatile TaxID=2884831 RepID=A0A953M335_9BACT|nr:hypothetical protein [Candidatus Nitrobium versatile]